MENLLRWLFAQGSIYPELPVAVGRGPDGGCHGGDHDVSVYALLTIELLLVPEKALHPLLEAVDVVVNAALQQCHN